MMLRLLRSVLLSVLLLIIAAPIVAQHAIDTAMAIDVGGIRQWITMKGTSATNPVLLFLHGGPGNSVISYAEKFTGELHKKFVVVQWDQRESGKTAELNASERPLSVELMETDAIEVIHYLQKRFSQEKIYLMGHSWGGFLGLLISSHHPELLSGYIAICPMIHQVESETFSLQWMKDKAKAVHNSKAQEDLSKVHIPFESGEQLYYHRKWLIHFMSGKFPSRAVVISWSEKWLTLFNEASKVNFFQSAPSLECPIYFFAGEKDIQTSTKLTIDYYHAVKAEKKKLFVFEGIAHNLPASEPIKLQQTILKEVLK